jgi:hypothetical protein
MTDIFEDIFEEKEQGAPEERKEAEIVDFPEPVKRNKGGVETWPAYALE